MMLSTHLAGASVVRVLAWCVFGAAPTRSGGGDAAGTCGDETARSPGPAGGWVQGGECCGVEDWAGGAAELRAALGDRLSDCGSVELQVAFSRGGGARLDRVGCFWPTLGPGAGDAGRALNASRAAHFARARVPADVAEWVERRVANLERRRRCPVVGWAEDGPSRSKVYVEEFSFDPGWQRLDRAGFPALEARVWDPRNFTAAAVAADKRYDHFSASTAAEKLAAALPYFADAPEDAKSVADAFEGFVEYVMTSTTNVARAGGEAEATNSAFAARLVDPRKRPGATLDALARAEAPLARFLGLGAAPCAASPDARAASWLACADAVMADAAPGAFLNNVQLSRTNARGDPYLVLYYSAKQPEPAGHRAWLAHCCRTTAPPGQLQHCPS